MLGCGRIVKSSDPEKFVILIAKSADSSLGKLFEKKYFQVFQIHFSVLEHIHTLSQEALDHADLSVLTATIGAAALVKNSLWVNLQCTKIKMCPCRNENGGSLKVGAGLVLKNESINRCFIDCRCATINK
jgi:protein KIAA0825